MQAFGLGCFYFGFDLSDSREAVSGAGYAEIVKSALEGIPSVSDVNFDPAPAGVAPVQLEEVDTTQRCRYPAPMAFALLFDVRIPRRVQRDLARGHLGWMSNTEHFRVKVDGSRSYPLTLVLPLGEDYRGSNGVLQVREFLQKELGKLETPIRLEVLGPSPVHADALVVERRQDSEPNENPLDELGEVVVPFKLAMRERRGYEALVYQYRPETYSTPIEAALDFFDRAAQELELFYDFSEFGRRTLLGGHDFSERLEDLIERQEARGWGATWDRLTRFSRDLNAAFVSLAQFASNRSLEEQQLTMRQRDLYEARSEAYLRTIVDREAAESVDYPVEQWSSVLKMFEQRRISDKGLAIALASSVFGGAVGAALTAILTG